MRRLRSERFAANPLSGSRRDSLYRRLRPGAVCTLLRLSLRADLTCALFFFFNDTATTEIYTLSLHDALPICWDLAFQCVTIARVDPEFAKSQLLLLLREWYMHPNGQIPAYEWAFSDVNPPVHAWAALRV